MALKTLELTYNTAADLYWFAFLLTGHKQLSLDVTLEALNFVGSRRYLIATALAAIDVELAASARRTRWLRREKAAIPNPAWCLDPNTTKFQLENALLAIDTFPRCALLLTVFEGLKLDEASSLLGSDRKLVGDGRIVGLLDLTSNLAAMEGWPSTTKAHGSQTDVLYA